LFFFSPKNQGSKGGHSKTKGVKEDTKIADAKERSSSRESTKVAALKEGIVTAAWQKRAPRTQLSRRTRKS
jgi:hypothetical protein